MGAALLAAGGSLLGGTSSLVGGKKGAQAATQAANIQAQAAMAAANLQQQRFEQAAGTLQPFISYGEQFMQPLQQLMGIGGGAQGVLGSTLGQMPGTWAPTMQNLQNMPGYQFQLQQGLQAAQSNMAASGLGRSGAATKAATQYASGLAATNWQSNFNQWLQQQQLTMAGQQQLYNMLAAPIGTGLGAAGAVAGVGVQTGAQIGNALQAAGAAQAGGITSAAQQQIAGLQGAAGTFASAPYAYLTANALASQGQQNPINPYGTQVGSTYYGPGVNPSYSY